MEPARNQKTNRLRDKKNPSSPSLQVIDIAGEGVPEAGERQRGSGGGLRPTDAGTAGPVYLDSRLRKSTNVTVECLNDSALFTGLKSDRVVLNSDGFIVDAMGKV